MDGYTLLGRIGEGAHGVVIKASRKQTAETVALKRIPLKNPINNAIPNTVLREIRALQEIDSEYVVKLLDVIPHGSGFVLVFEYVETELLDVLRRSSGRLPTPLIKSYMSMLLKGVDYCHKLKILHRDLKPANLLISSSGQLKIADFGLARVVNPFGERPLSHQVATRWYRAPELLYGARKYDEGIDLWAVGCIFGEMLNHSPLFPGENDIDQLCIVLRALGTPTEETWPGVTSLPDYNKIDFPEMAALPIQELVPDASEDALDLLSRFLKYPCKERIDAESALVHAYFFTPPLADSSGIQLDPYRYDSNTLVDPNLLLEIL